MFFVHYLNLQLNMEVAIKGFEVTPRIYPPIWVSEKFQSISCPLIMTLFTHKQLSSDSPTSRYMVGKVKMGQPECIEKGRERARYVRLNAAASLIIKL